MSGMMIKKHTVISFEIPKTLISANVGDMPEFSFLTLKYPPT